jgi:hypothetical protein
MPSDRPPTARGTPKSLSRLEVAALCAGIVTGLAGLIVATLGYLRSGEALDIARATARAQLQITEAYLLSVPKKGDHLALDVTLKNFGQSSAEKVRVTFFHSEYPILPTWSQGVQGSMPPGYTYTMRLADFYQWASDERKDLAFFIKVSYVDSSSKKEEVFETAYSVRKSAMPNPSDGRIPLRAMVN